MMFVTSFSPSDVASKIEKVILRNKRTNGRKRIIELELDNPTIA